jgi:hypothetical protein
MLWVSDSSALSRGVSSRLYSNTFICILSIHIVSIHSLGATLSNFLGQVMVERYGHISSLVASLFMSFVPIVLFCFMPETLGLRGSKPTTQKIDESGMYKLAID